MSERDSIVLSMTDQDRTRFWSNVDKNGPDECWPWAGYLFANGYGAFHVSTVRGNFIAHRVALILTIGTPPDGKPFACHSCDNPPCCNPAHLWFGSPKDNLRDAADKGRMTSWKKVLTAASVLSIRSRAAAGETSSALANEFGVSMSNIRLIVRRRTWKHVP